MSKVACHFWDTTADAGKLSHSKCEKDATVFVRPEHTKRLCPLCPACFSTFESAQKTMSEDVKKTIPGTGEYTVIPVAEGAEEFASQPPKK